MEILVAAALLSLAILAVTAVVRKGRELGISDLHRRQARAIVNARLESEDYDRTNYANLQPINGETVTIEDRDAPNVDVTGTLTATIQQDPVAVTDALGNAVPYREVRMRIIWAEPEGPDTVTVVKRVAR